METRSEDDYKAALAALQASGIWHHTWISEAMPVGGCGAKIRPQDWGAGVRRGENDCLRRIYHIEVLSDDRARAMQVIAG